jgi:uncharacterized protein
MTNTSNDPKGLYRAPPVFKVEGKEQPSLADALEYLEVADDARGMARLEGRFTNWTTPPGGGTPAFAFFDGGVIAFGKKLELTLGPEGSAKRVFTGRITAIGGAYRNDMAPAITLLAEDSLQLLRMTRRTRTYEDVTDEDVVKTIASAHKLDVSPDAPGPKHKVLVQVGQTDLQFLRERADDCDAQLWVEGEKMFFVARSKRSAGDVTLSLGNDLTRFEARADLAEQVTSTIGHGYEVASKTDPAEEAAKTLVSQEAKKGKTGTALFDKVFGDRPLHLLDRAPQDAAEAKAIAQAALLRRARSFVRCRGETNGSAAMRVGSRLVVSGVGPVFEGGYFATRVIHCYDRELGFRTMFEGERAVVNEES